MIQAGLQLFRKTRAETLSRVRGLSQEQMDFSLATGRWSIGEVVDHLLLSEKLYRQDFAELIELAKSGREPLVRRSSRDVNFSPVFLPKSLLPMMEIPLTMMNLFVPRALREFLIRSRLIAGQSPDTANPRWARPASDLRRELSESLEQTASLLEAHADLDYSHMTMQHPLLGKNNVPQLLRIISLHEQRHQEQIDETLKSPRFPQAVSRTAEARG